MMNFNLCYHKDCRKKVDYLAKDGTGYCSKHSMMIIEGYGIEEFWPHYHESICKDWAYKKRREEEDIKRRIEREAFRNLEKETYRDRSYKVMRKK